MAGTEPPPSRRRVARGLTLGIGLVVLASLPEARPGCGWARRAGRRVAVASSSCRAPSVGPAIVIPRGGLVLGGALMLVWGSQARAFRRFVRCSWVPAARGAVDRLDRRGNPGCSRPATSRSAPRGADVGGRGCGGVRCRGRLAGRRDHSSSASPCSALFFTGTPLPARCGVGFELRSWSVTRPKVTAKDQGRPQAPDQRPRTGPRDAEDQTVPPMKGFVEAMGGVGGGGGRARRRGRPRGRRGRPHAQAGSHAGKGGYKLPPLDLLRAAPPSPTDGHEEHTMDALERTFRTFGVPARVPTAHRGPTVTLYEVEVEAGTKVNRVLTLADDIAYALATPDVRIIAPIPGGSAIGVEVPNKVRDFVMLGDVLRSQNAKTEKHPSRVGLGKDVHGRAVLVNLATMPHVPIAGATGAGKSSRQQLHHVDPDAGDARRGEARPGRPQAGRAQPLRGTPAPAVASDRAPQASRRGPGLGRPGDGDALRDARDLRGPRHRRVPGGPAGGDASIPPGREPSTGTCPTWWW